MSFFSLGIGSFTRETAGIPFPTGAKHFSPLHRVKTDPGTHPSSFPMGTEGSFRGGKVAGV
jgi:hypothetical protein